MDKKILIATNNPGKRLEIQALLADLDVTLVTPDEVGIRLEVDEHGTTYAENALLKANAFSNAAAMLALADDSGLEVDALGGAPGLHSARFSPKSGASDADRRKLLLERLAIHPRPWEARFRCVVALAAPGIEPQLFEGVCPGEIIPEERGTHGFGYDPVFLLQEVGVTMAELPTREKNHLSHRARAVIAARPAILSILRMN